MSERILANDTRNLEAILEPDSHRLQLLPILLIYKGFWVLSKILVSRLGKKSVFVAVFHATDQLSSGTRNNLDIRDLGALRKSRSTSRLRGTNLRVSLTISALKLSPVRNGSRVP
jgi:hypothetical protein